MEVAYKFLFALTRASATSEACVAKHSPRSRRSQLLHAHNTVSPFRRLNAVILRKLFGLIDRQSPDFLIFASAELNLLSCPRQRSICL